MTIVAEPPTPAAEAASAEDLNYLLAEDLNYFLAALQIADQDDSIIGFRSTPRLHPSVTAALIQRVSQLLERDGWTQGFLGPCEVTERGPRCLAGAVSAAINERYGRGLGGLQRAWLCSDLMKAIATPLQMGAHELLAWNDERGRRSGEIHRLLRSALELTG